MEKIILLNPGGTKGTSLSLEKYNLLKEAIVEVFLMHSTATQEEILNYVSKKLSNTFENDISKLVDLVLPDLEARSFIEQVAGTVPVQFRLKLIRC
jgi:uncharacterized protein DUF6958